MLQWQQKVRTYSMTNKFNLSAEDKKMCNSMFWRTMTLSATYNYETMQALGFMYAMMPAINRFYKTEEERKAAIKRHNEIFNTTPTMGGMITGLAASMEKEAAENPDFDTASISAVKVALMGPFAGIGDSLFWGTVRVISLGIGISLAASGSILGAIMHLVLYNVPAHILRFYGLRAAYALGGNLMSNASESGLMGVITKGAGIVGLMTVGAMTVTMVSCNIPLVVELQGSQIVVQDALDAIFPNLLPLLITYICYVALKKDVKPWVIMIVMFVIGALGKVVGIF